MAEVLSSSLKYPITPDAIRKRIATGIPAKSNTELGSLVSYFPVQQVAQVAKIVRTDNTINIEPHNLAVSFFIFIALALGSV